MIKYCDKVKIKNGFYEGCRGIVVGTIIYSTELTMYEVEIGKMDVESCFRKKTIEVGIDLLEKIEEAPMKFGYN